MARTTIIQLTDDLDGGEAVEQITFALRGIEYEIDLGPKNAAALDRALGKYIAAGRRVKPSRSRGRSNGAQSTAPDPGAIREWARANGFEVSSRGRISEALRAAFAAAG